LRLVALVGFVTKAGRDVLCSEQILREILERGDEGLVGVWEVAKHNERVLEVSDGDTDGLELVDAVCDLTKVCVEVASFCHADVEQTTAKVELHSGGRAFKLLAESVPDNGRVFRVARVHEEVVVQGEANDGVGTTNLGERGLVRRRG
jgi:hypothetical protein